MKATLLQLKRDTDKIIKAIERNETVTLCKHGKEIAQIVPTRAPEKKASIRDNPAIGMWADHEEMNDPAQYVRTLRRERHRAL